jgi:tetratricopeptide (TPR) repeat protein
MSPADWALKSEEFGDLSEEIGAGRERFVAMELISPGADDAAFVDRLWQLWLEMPQARTMLHAVRRTRLDRLLVRYAALDWKREPVSIEHTAGARTVATWGVELTRLFDFVSVCVPDGELGWFTCPIVKIDLQGTPRVGFVSPASNTTLMKRAPPEVLARWPDGDELSLVFAVGQLLLGLVAVGAGTAKTPLGKIILRCLDPKPQNRFPTLALLRDALVEAGGIRATPPLVDRTQVWNHLEMGIGYAAIGLPTRALARFEWALVHDAGSQRAIHGRDAMLARGADPEKAGVDHELARKRAMEKLIAGIPGDAPMRRPERTTATQRWAEAEPMASKLECAGQWAAAVELYHSVVLDDAATPLVYTALARCHLGARDYGFAIDYARRAIAATRTAVEPHRLLVEALVGRNDLRDALDASESWLPLAKEPGHVHHVRGKILLALGRLAEARAELDIACELAPKNLSVLLLRRQVDRTITRVRARAGHAGPAPDLPAHLRAVRDLLVAGHTAEAIAWLDKPEHAGDLQAQLLRAELLLFCEQFDAALAAFEKTGGLAGKLGQATALVRMGRPEQALALCDALVREHPMASEPHEGRAAALQALGRATEADEAYKRAVAAGAQRTEARVRLGRG